MDLVEIYVYVSNHYDSLNNTNNNNKKEIVFAGPRYKKMKQKKQKNIEAIVYCIVSELNYLKLYKDMVILVFSLLLYYLHAFLFLLSYFLLYYYNKNKIYQRPHQNSLLAFVHFLCVACHHAISSSLPSSRLLPSFAFGFRVQTTNEVSA